MAYKCVHCSALYEDSSSSVLTGCESCKSKFFFYIRPEKLKEIEEQKAQEAAETTVRLSNTEKEQIEKDIREIVGLDEDDTQTAVFLDFESVRVLKPGKYALDLDKLFAMNKPRVYQLEDGKYIVDLAGKKASSN